MNDGILLFRDEAYGEHEKQRYDLALPRERADTHGLVLCVHGGAFIAGDKDTYAGEIVMWAGRGFAAAAVNYHYVSDEIHLDTLNKDLALALNAIWKKAAGCGTVLDRMLLTGESAGSHLALFYAYSMAQASPIRPVGVVEYCGSTLLTDRDLLHDVPENDRAELLKWMTGVPSRPEDREAQRRELLRYSPLSYVETGAVPTVICHGQRDGTVPFSNAKALFDALLERGVETVLLAMPEGGHQLEQPEIYEESRELFRLWAERFLRN